jgi:hypothetical protein
MTDIPNDDKAGFVAEKPEHCFACYRLIRPGQTYYLTIEGIVHCEDCALSQGTIRVREDLIVEVRRDLPVLQPGTTQVEDCPLEVRHLVNALPMTRRIWIGVGYRESSKRLYSSTVSPMSRMILRSKGRTITCFP